MAPTISAMKQKLESMKQKRAQKWADFKDGKDAVANLSSVIVLTLGVVFGIVGILILANLGPSLIRAGGNLTTAITTTDTGNSTANALRSPLALLVAIVILLGLVMMAIRLVVGRDE